MTHIVMVTQGTQGDLLPFIRLGRGLRARGHTVILATHLAFIDQVRRSGLEPLALDNEEHPGVNTPDKLSQGAEMSLGAVMENIKASLSIIPAQFRVIQSVCRPGQTLLISHQNSLVITQMVAEQLRLKLATIFPSPFFVSVLPLYIEISRMLNHFNAVRAEVGLPAVASWLPCLQSSRLNLGLWPEWFAVQERDWLLRCRPVGFMLPEPEMIGELPPEVERLLELCPVMITASSTVPASPEFFSAPARVCERLGLPTLLVTPYQEQVRGLISEQAHWFARLPFDVVLPRCRLIFHHGGIGTCVQSLAACVPQIILAYGWDRPDNAARFQRLRVAEYLPKPRWQAEAVDQALTRMLNSLEVRPRCQLISEQLATDDPITAACDAIEAYR